MKIMFFVFGILFASSIGLEGALLKELNKKMIFAELKCSFLTIGCQNYCSKTQCDDMYNHCKKVEIK